MVEASFPAPSFIAFFLKLLELLDILCLEFGIDYCAALHVRYLTSCTELSSTSRAGCKNKECLDNGVKIQKGELRFGTQIEIQEHQTWHWRHWYEL